ncbi:MAG: TSUP family transporter [Solobacterium sp.]|nr:TSUP family transporter [Solobacterium sp.]
MELIWYITAAVAAGIGTGLAGLSAATVMVPVLIVLCPSFSGETGAYQATAIALASDILGSAVTAYTYAVHRNIDLRRGWIMMVCILVMCTAGSYAAYIVGNVVLGSFTLFLTFFIGIRFLVSPDTGRKNAADKGEKLDWKGIAVSLFFGLTIGFGTGFVGTGGGMMMLVVFTVFLGMDLKTAVGTSTFIMAFTALIASVSHIFIHPAILLEKWDVMLLCIVTATASSLLSARFANRVRSHTVGLLTGLVLTLLGGTMLLLYFRTQIQTVPLFADTLQCLGRLVRYIIPCVSVLLPVRILTKIPSYIFRKLLHIVAFSCFSVMLIGAQGWQPVALASVLIAAALFPLLAAFEKEEWYSGLFVEKSGGEIKKSLLKLFLMFAALTAAAWGVFGKSHAAAAAILMWGTGDAAAALTGIPWGKHKVYFRPVCGKKSWEGTIGMFAVSFTAGFIMLFPVCGISPGKSFAGALCGAAVGAAVELVSEGEWDTVTVPAAVLVPLLLIC